MTELYQSNLQLLEERFGPQPLLHNPEIPQGEQWQIEEGPRGHLWAKYQGRALCSRHDPLREARRLIEGQHTEYQTLCLFGLGLGYNAQVWVEEHPGGRLILLISHWSYLVQAMAARDLSPILKHGDLHLLVQPNRDSFTALLKELQLTACQIMAHRSLYDLHREYFEELKTVLALWLNRKEVNRNTLRRFGELWVKNFRSNLPFLGEALSLEPLKNLFPDSPALVLGAGPSLEDILPMLKQLQKKMLIIAVDTAYRSMLNQGVEPDFLVITDPQYWNCRHLDFCRPTGLLVADSSTHPKVLRGSFKKLLLSASPFPLAKAFEEGFLDYKLPSGGSVATAAWSLAVHLGCPEIYLAGQDLSYPEGQTHCRGSYFEERSLSLCNRLQGPEHHGWLALHNAPAIFRPSQQPGKQIQSDQRMSIYLDWFSESIPQEQNITYNLSSRGAMIKGALYRDPQTLLELPDQRGSIASALERVEAMGSPFSTEELRSKGKELIEEMKEMAHWAKQGRESSLKLERAFHGGRNMAVQLEELDNIDQALSAKSAHSIGGFLIEPLLEEMLEKQQGTPEDLLKNSKRLYQEMEQSLIFHIGQLDLALNTLKK